MKAADGRKPAPGRPSQRPDARTRPDLGLFARNALFAALVGRPLDLPTMTVGEIAEDYALHPETVRRALAAVGVRPDAGTDDGPGEPDADRNARIERNARRRRTKPQPRYSGRNDAA